MPGPTAVRWPPARHLPDTWGAHAGAVTASPHCTSDHVVAVAGGPLRDRHLHRGDGPVHAVSRPVVDGLAASVCGALVVAMADQDWRRATGVDRCEECRRLAG